MCPYTWECMPLEYEHFGSVAGCVISGLSGLHAAFYLISSLYGCVSAISNIFVRFVALFEIRGCWLKNKTQCDVICLIFNLSICWNVFKLLSCTQLTEKPVALNRVCVNFTSKILLASLRFRRRRADFFLHFSYFWNQSQRQEFLTVKLSFSVDSGIVDMFFKTESFAAVNFWTLN